MQPHFQSGESRKNSAVGARTTRDKRHGTRNTPTTAPEAICARQHSLSVDRQIALLSQERIGNRATVAMVQRAIYKDEEAKADGFRYENIARVPWYRQLSAEQKEVAMALHKDRKQLTVDEAEARIEAILGGEFWRGEQGEVRSSELEHREVDEPDRILTIAEFDKLPAEGWISPYRLRTAQGDIEDELEEGRFGTVYDLRNRLVHNPRFSETIPSVEIGVHHGQVRSSDTQIVVAFQMAREENSDVQIRYVKKVRTELPYRVGSIYSSHRWSGLVSVIRHQAKRGVASQSQSSVPYINPAYKAQLRDDVRSVWQGGTERGCSS